MSDRALQSDVEAIAAIDAVPNILEVICRATGMGFAAVARVTDNRWIACAVRDEIAFGLKPGGELKVETTICNEIRASGEAVVIDHVAADQTFCSHPTPAMYGFQSYISVPIFRADKSFFGTLCAIDPRPMKLNRPEVIGMFKLFAELIRFYLEERAKLASSETALAQERARLAVSEKALFVERAKVASGETALFDEQAAGELREQFIAVMGHDLRNPLASIDAGARQLQRIAKGEKATEIITLIQKSVRRMAGLIDNVLDLARGRLGGGLPLYRDTQPLGPALRQVIDELRGAWPDREIIAEGIDVGPVHCDHGRICQLLSNFVANALTHGGAGAPVHVKSRRDDGMFELSVANAGKPIPPVVLEQIFEPFFRSSFKHASQQGLGLGLYIASEIAQAHGGTLEVTSEEGHTCFTFRMPVS